VIVLDASALLALLHREAGWDVVARAAGADSATVSAVNPAEVLQKTAQHGLAAEDVDAALEALGITVTPFGRLDARLAAPSSGTVLGSALATGSAWRWPGVCRALPSPRIASGSAGQTTWAWTSA
jgi:predicted nucleic acid-binding protein